MELATRTFAKKHINELKKCIERDAAITYSEKRKWMDTKDEGHHLFDPMAGGSYAVFNERPLSDTIQKYCIQDIIHLPGLWSMYSAKLSPKTRSKVHEATQARLEESRRAEFTGQGRYMALPPWPGWPASANPNPTTISDKQNHMTNVQQDQISNPLKLSFKTQLEAGKQAEARSAKSTTLDLDIATLTLDAASVGAAVSDKGPVAIEEHVSASINEEAGPKGKLEGLLNTRDRCASVNADEHSGPDPEGKADQGWSTIVSRALADSQSRNWRGSGRSDESGGEDVYDDDIRYGYSRGSESPEDFTACSADDCGYCGHCSY